MQAMVANLREALHTLAEQLPEGATWKDVAYEAYVRQEIEAGLEEARRGAFAPPWRTRCRCPASVTVQSIGRTAKACAWTRR
jgi:hypothetical protein